MTPIRWFASRQVWVQIIGLINAVATLALSQLSTLGLAPARYFWWSMALTALVNIAGIALRVWPDDPAPPIASQATIDAVAK